MEQLLATVLLRPMQSLSTAAPTLLVGIFTAAILRGMVGPRSVRRLFGDEGRGGLPRALLLGVLLPVDSFGVLPVVRELRRCGVTMPKLVVFALAAPMLGPLTLVYALTAVELSTVVLLVVTTVLVALVGGAIASMWKGHSGASRVGPDAAGPSSVWRLANTAVAAGRICVPAVIGDVLIALGVAGLMAAMIDAHELPHVLSSAGVLAVPIMALVSLFAYIAPATGVMQVAGMADMQLPLGAAIGLHVFGVGQNAALCVWFLRQLGLRRLAVLGLAILASSWVLGLAADATIGDAFTANRHGHDDHDQNCTYPCHGKHNHALDGLGRQCGPLRNPLNQAFRYTSVSGFVALGLLGVLCLAGAVFRLAGIDVRKDSSVLGTADDAGFWNRPISGRWLGMIAVVLLAAVPVVAIYVYYPPVDELFTQMTFVRANAVLAVKNGPREQAVRELKAWSNLAGKAQVSAMLRGRPVDSEALQSTSELRRNLEMLRKAVIEDRNDDLQQLVRRVMDAYDRCRWAYVHR